MKKLRRQVFIREKDFYDRLLPDAYRVGYDSAEFIPITIPGLAKEMTWQLLQGKDVGNSMFISTREESIVSELLDSISDEERTARIYLHFLMHHKQLYNPNYKKWAWKYVPESGILLRYKSNTDWSPLGIAVLKIG